MFAERGDKEDNVEVMTAEPNWEDEQETISNLTAICIVGIEDPVRPEVSLVRTNSVVLISTQAHAIAEVNIFADKLLFLWTHS